MKNLLEEGPVKFIYFSLEFICYQSAEVGQLLKKQDGRGAIVACICAGTLKDILRYYICIYRSTHC